MTDQQKLDDIHARVTAWSERAIADGISFAEALQDEECVQLLNELIEIDNDDLMVLIGRSIQEAGEMPDWLTDGLDNSLPS